MRRLFATLEPGTVEALNEVAADAEDLVARTSIAGVPMLGPAGDPFLGRWQAADPLVEATLL